MQSALPHIVSLGNSATVILAHLHITGSNASVRRDSVVEGVTGGLKGFLLNMKELFAVPLDASREYVGAYSQLKP